MEINILVQGILLVPAIPGQPLTQTIVILACQGAFVKGPCCMCSDVSKVGEKADLMA